MRKHCEKKEAKGTRAAPTSDTKTELSSGKPNSRVFMTKEAHGASEIKREINSSSVSSCART